VSGSIPDARALAFEFAASLVITKRDGTVVRRPWRLQPFPGDFTKRLTG
jgi:hypothetical protein